MIRFSPPLIKATLVKRYKRFLADALLEDGTAVTAHCPNTGSMKSCGEPGDIIFLRPTPEPNKKLKYCWEYTQTAAGLIGINTMRTNSIVKQALEKKRIKELSGYQEVRSEVKFSDKTRFDFLLSNHIDENPDCFVEVKNVTLFENQIFRFPDAVTTRGHKHLTELIKAKESGLSAVLIFLVNRPETATFECAANVDPAYASELKRAHNNGVKILVFQTKNTLEGILLQKPVSFCIS
jgi:sugar fermentation stimulation protein A